MTASEVAKFFISLVDEEAGDSISNLKLQKLLYYAQGFHLAYYGKPLFPEQIKAWIHGPVVPQVYHEYKEYGSGPIPIQPYDSSGMSDELRDILTEIYSVYGQFSASKLRDLTHSEPPWANTPQSEAIPLEAMRQFFKTLLVQDDNKETSAE